MIHSVLPKPTILCDSSWWWTFFRRTSLAIKVNHGTVSRPPPTMESPAAFLHPIPNGAQSVQSTNSSGSPGPALAILVTPMTRTPTPGRMATHSAQTGPNIPSFQHPSSLNPVRPESSSCVRPVRLFGATLFPTLGSPAVAGPSCYPASVPGRESFALRGLAYQYDWCLELKLSSYFM
jgi:hypothetical protein